MIKGLTWCFTWCFIFLLLIPNSLSFRISSWIVDGGDNDVGINWTYYSHIKYSTPMVFPNGTAICGPNKKTILNLTDTAHHFDTKILWGLGFDFNPAKLNFEKIKNYLDSIGEAVRDCNIDGIEVDYEWNNNNWGKTGFIPHRLSNIYSYFLKDIKLAIGTNKTVSADVSGWGVYLFGFNPWVNVTMLNNGDFDFVNVMSYYYSESGDLFRWEKDMDLFKNKWGIDPLRVNIGIPYFSVNTSLFKTLNQPSWKTLSPFCKNINPSVNSCDKLLFIGKEMNFNIGRLIKNHGFGGAFPWAANYDSFAYNNSLIPWLYRGLYN